MTRWYKERKREHYYKKAKIEGYRARSAYKLKQIQKKFKIIKKNDWVLDLGAAPGGWSQVVKEIVGAKGLVVGVDKNHIKPLDGVIFLKGDLTEEQTIKELKKVLGNKKVDVILSDMSPDISGNYSVDHAQSIYLSNIALNIADVLLEKGGNFICKVFDGAYLNSFFKQLNKRFVFVKRFSPPASRKSSSELYLISKEYINPKKIVKKVAHNKKIYFYI